MLHNIQLRNNAKSGITLLLTVFIMTIALSIATGIFTLLLSEFSIAGDHSRSVKAFYAANAGVECVLYHEFQEQNFFSTTTPPVGTDVKCGGIDASSFNFDSAANTFTFRIGFGNGACTDITVVKDNTATGPLTTIESRGRNTCGIGRKVERAIRVKLQR